MNCFQHIPESCGALHNPRGGAPQQRGPLTPQTQTRPNRLHTHTHPPKRLAHPRSSIPPLSKMTSRASHAHPTLTRSTGFFAIWDCISSSSAENVSQDDHAHGRDAPHKTHTPRKRLCTRVLTRRRTLHSPQVTRKSRRTPDAPARPPPLASLNANTTNTNPGHPGPSIPPPLLGSQSPDVDHLNLGS